MNVMRTLGKMMIRQTGNSRSASLLALALMALPIPPAQAHAAIVVGQSCDLSGATGARGREYIKGVDAFIDRLNEPQGRRRPAVWRPQRSRFNFDETLFST